MLIDHWGRAFAVLEAKNIAVTLTTGAVQVRRYSDLLAGPFIFLTNGAGVWFCDKECYVRFRRVEDVLSQYDAARLKAALDAAVAKADGLASAISAEIFG